MNIFRFASAACLAASFAFVSAPSGAAPFAPVQTQTTSADSLIVQVNGCHSDVRRAYVREFGRTTTHRHQRDCRPVRVTTGGARDCHRNAQRHRLPGYGGSVVHRHVGSNCRVRVLRRYDRGGRNCVTFGPIRYCEG